MPIGAENPLSALRFGVNMNYILIAADGVYFFSDYQSAFSFGVQYCLSGFNIEVVSD